MALTNEERVARGRRARELIDDPMLREVLDAMVEKACTEILASEPSQTAQREISYSRGHAAMLVQTALRTIQSDGDAALQDMAQAGRDQAAAAADRG